MNRYGMNLSMLGKVCTFLQSQPLIFVEGIYSHLYTCQNCISEEQRVLFAKHTAVCKRYFPSVLAHLGATYGSLLGEKFTLDMVRVGLGLYGYFPQGMQEKEMQIAKSLRLEKAMTVSTVVSADRKYVFGGAGYGLTKLERGSRLAVYRCGYADGFLRKRENGILGSERNANVSCMDVCIRAENKKRGTRALLLTDAEETAAKTETVSYEVLCAATSRAEFVYDYE